MNPEQAIKFLEKYHRFNVLMELLIETIGNPEEIKNVSDLGKGIGEMNKKFKEAQEVVKSTLKGERIEDAETQQ